MLAIDSRGNVPFLVGGTGLYFRALLEGLLDVRIPPGEREAIRATLEPRTTEDLYAELEKQDPDRASALSRNDRVRISRALELIAYTGKPVTELFRSAGRPAVECDTLAFVLTMPRPLLRARVEERTRELFAAGWVNEVRGLVAGGLSLTAPGMRSLGYGEIAEAVAAGEDPAETVTRVVTITQQYAKRQETFFRGMEGVVWLDVTESGFIQRMDERIAAHSAGRDQ
jgi:tRNA dimethylallyltransferase